MWCLVIVSIFMGLGGAKGVKVIIWVATDCVKNI